MKKALWVAVALGIAAAGAWVYAALARQENDDGRQVRLLAIAEQVVNLSSVIGGFGIARTKTLGGM